VTLRIGIVAVAAAVLAYLAMWGLWVFVCLLGAAGGWTFLWSPTSWTLRAVYVAVAILVGLLTFRHGAREWELSPRLAAVPAGLALAAALAVTGSMHAYGVSREHHYLKYLPAGMSREAGLAYGHQACDWLAAQRWGQPSAGRIPPGGGGTYILAGPLKTLVYQPVRARLPSPGGWHWANSTRYWLFHYIDHLDAQHPGPLTQNERQQASVTGSAWFELCPFQQWVHRPINGGGTGD
jgi:hypothetical protein